MSQPTIIQIGSANIPVVESYDQMKTLLAESNGFIDVTDAISNTPLGLSTKDIHLYRPASSAEREQIQKVRLESSGITIPNMTAPPLPRT